MPAEASMATKALVPPPVGIARTPILALAFAINTEGRFDAGKVKLEKS
jgi:hypothetical protein